MSQKIMPYELLHAHTPGKTNKWHNLSEHLVKVAEMAAQFASVFPQGQTQAFIAGLAHDLGKAKQEFQQYLKARHNNESHKVVPHAKWGSAVLYANTNSYDFWKDVVLPVAGHHEGLQEPGTISAKLKDYIDNNRDLIEQLRQFFVHLVQKHPPGHFNQQAFLSNEKRELYIRMLFSALVDADRLDTEQHFDKEQAALRGKWPGIEELWTQFKTNQDELFKNTSTTQINEIRKSIYHACTTAASGQQGFYRLTVPTGGGKTRSGLAFALNHALKHGLRRIVVAIPFTSIIDQTAIAYKEILGQEAVLEHHSQISISTSEDQDELSLRLRLSAENWEHPLIVTTTVQLFESLFNNNPSQCRKLHNLAQSVILLDEVQTLPPELLKPTVDVLRTLVEDYKVTVVLSTATQPFLERLLEGVKIKEIIPQYNKHFTILRRVDYEYRKLNASFESLADELLNYPQVMAVVNTKKDAIRLFESLEHRDDNFHLSTLLCGAHRKEILKTVQERLKNNKTVQLVSTQVVEAGVDIDFPVVYRAIGPLDRIVQAAGRCNREGRLKAGKAVIFEFEDGSVPKGPYKQGLEKARLLLGRYGPDALHDPEIYEEYFQRLFHDVDTDKYKIQPLRKAFNYPEVSKKYRMIPDDTVSVVVNYKNVEKKLQNWIKKPSKASWQALQPYLVSLYKYELDRLAQDGWAELINEGLYRWIGLYDERKGIVKAQHDPADLII